MENIMENTISEIIDEIIDASTLEYTYLFNDSPEEFIRLIDEVVQIYIESGARSSKKVDKLHGYIKSVIDRHLIDRGLLQNYTVVLEYNVPSLNSSGKKCCDIVVLKEGVPF
jgi:hypothetical protein